MHPNNKSTAVLSVETIRAEAARVEEMIAAATERINSSECSLKTFMHMQVCRAELQAYLAGLLYSLGYTQLLDTQYLVANLNLPGNEGTEQSLLFLCEDEACSQQIQ